MRAEGFVPHAAKVTAALSAAATTAQHLGDQPHSHGRTSPKENQAYSQLLFGRGSGGGASLREAASPGVPYFRFFFATYSCWSACSMNSGMLVMPLW